MKNTQANWEKIRQIWIEYIDQNVNSSSLYSELDALHAQGYSPDYLQYAICYTLRHGMRLNYPAGLKYYVNNPKIKIGYVKFLNKLKQQGGKVTNYDETPDCAPTKQKDGIEDILKRG